MQASKPTTSMLTYENGYEYIQDEFGLGKWRYVKEHDERAKNVQSK